MHLGWNTLNNEDDIQNWRDHNFAIDFFFPFLRTADNMHALRANIDAQNSFEPIYPFVWPVDSQKEIPNLIFHHLNRNKKKKSADRIRIRRAQSEKKFP